MIKKRRPIQITGTLDLECSDWSNFVVGATYDGHLPRLWRDLDLMIDYLRARGGTWWAHAGGVYDLLAILERARVRGISCQIDKSQHKVSRIVMGRLTLRDSYGLWPSPLDELAAALRVPVPSLPWPCICEKRDRKIDGRLGCGGWCQIKPRAAQGDPELEEYCIADCRVLYDGLHLLDEFAQNNKISLRGTIGQTAWIAAQDELGLPDSEIPWGIYRHAKRGDKGGRIAVIRPTSHGPGSIHDICNAYPGQLAKADLPVGTCRELSGPNARRALRNCRPGIYTLTVHVPDDLFLPPLPWHHGGMMTFPTGTFVGSWALPELVAAFERGVSVIEVHSALIWKATANIFAPLLERWYEIRRKAGRKTPLGQWVGRLAKAFTGKLAERPDRNRVTMHPEAIKVCLRKGRCRNGCTKRCGAYEQLDLAGHIYGIPYQKLGASAYPQWSAYLRAATRVQWLEQAEKYGEDLCMGNTDSLWTIGRKAPTPLGDGLGEWEFCGSWSELEVRSPQSYAFRDEHGVFQIRGVPGLTEEDWKRGHGTIDRGIVTLGASVGTQSGNLFTKRSRKWTLPKADRAYYLDRRMGSGGVTFPMDAEELRELAIARAEASRVTAELRALNRPGYGSREPQ